MRKIIDPKQFPDQDNRGKRPRSLLAVTHIKDNFPAHPWITSLKITANNTDYHLAEVIFVTFLTKQY